MKPCPICRCPAKEKYLPDDPDNVLVVACARCGSFKAEEEVCRDWKAIERTELEIANLSGWIRRNGAAELLLENIEEYRTLRTLTVVEKGDALLLHLSKDFPIPGMPMTMDWETVELLYDEAIHPEKQLIRSKVGYAQEEAWWAPLRFLSISGVSNPLELGWLINEYLRKEQLLTGKPHDTRISPKGWQRIEQLRTGGIESRSGFVAMNFAQEFDVLFDQVMTPGIEAAGYIANRVGKRQSNERIDDEIIAGIRECRFMVADASGHRPNVYYEAGYAKGLGRDVIWMVEEKDRATLHFDTRQYPYITWKRDALPEACKALEMRIAATIGRGPVRRDGTPS